MNHAGFRLVCESAVDRLGAKRARFILEQEIAAAKAAPRKRRSTKGKTYLRAVR